MQAQTVAATPQLVNAVADRPGTELVTGRRRRVFSNKIGNPATLGSTGGPSGSQAFSSRTAGNTSAERDEKPQLTPPPGHVAGETRVRLICDTHDQPTSTSPVFPDGVVVSGTSLTITALNEGVGWQKKVL